MFQAWSQRQSENITLNFQTESFAPAKNILKTRQQKPPGLPRIVKKKKKKISFFPMSSHQRCDETRQGCAAIVRHRGPTQLT